ncbi:MAG TPA: hypothetical protein ACFYD3_04350 [Candidatus Hypogeohydataceae bacterium YC41]
MILRLLIFLLISLVGCATPPRAVTLSEVAKNPLLYKNTPIQFAGLIKENHYSENFLGRWEVLVTDGQTELYCFKKGYNLGLLRRGAKLADEAKEEEGTVSVTGRLVTLHTIKETPTLEIQRLSYKGKSVNVETADYPDYYYGRYPYYPGYYYYPFYPGFSRPFPHHHHGHHGGRRCR